MTDSPQLLADQIAQHLGESEPSPLEQIRLIVEHFGPEFAQALLAEVEDIEASGGMTTSNGKRRRTPGGVYLYLARRRAATRDQRHIFKIKVPGRMRRMLAEQAADTPKEPAFTWTDRLTVLGDLLEERGDATNAKLTLIGRPGKVERHQDLIITTMSHTPKLPASLPKGVPQPPKEATIYTVFIAAKQWNKIADAIANPDDSLIVEGMCAFDPDVQGIALFAQSVTTRNLQRAKGETQKATQTAQTSAATPSPASSKPFDGPPSPEAVKRIGELRRAEQDTRQRLDELKSLPANEQVGMAKTLQELQRIKDDIKALKQQYPRLS